MSTLNERIRTNVFQSWKLALHALQEIRIIDRRYHVLTAAEKIDLAACLSRYPKVSEELDRIVAELVERGEEPRRVRVDLHAVIFCYYCQSDIAERLRWCPPLRWLVMRMAAGVLARVCDRIDREGWR